MKVEIKILILIIVCGFILRIANFSFPFLSAEEVRIAYRSYTLSEVGKDEFGRDWPLLFNSSEDYKLPVVSYLSALGVKIFGKNEFGVRIFFILIGTGLILVSYNLALNYTKNIKVALFTAVAVALSPILVFLSKVPNESIVLTFLIIFIFYFLTRRNTTIYVAGLLILSSMLVSKFSWFIMPLFILFLVFVQPNKFSFKIKSLFFIFTVMASLLSILIFLQVPQATRSFLENNLTLFSNLTIKNGIEHLRMQGIQSGWSPLMERVLFNKIEFAVVGLLHWFSHLSPNIYFGQFDKTGILNITSLGAFSKITIIPFLLGLFYLFQQKLNHKKLLLFLIFIFTFPASLVYPNYSLDLIILTIPLLAMIVGFGLINLRFKLRYLIILLMFFETAFNLLIIKPEVNYTNTTRPSWIVPIAEDVYAVSKGIKVGVSDNIVFDIAPYILWENPVSPEDNFLKIGLPYKYRQTSLNKIKMIGADNNFYECTPDENINLFLSQRDFEKINRTLNLVITKKYQDNLGNDLVYKIGNSICVN